MLVRFDRVMLDPLRIWPLVFVAQAMIWFIGFPDRPTIPAASPRYFEVSALVRFLILFACLVAGLLIGRALGAFRSSFEPPMVRRLATYRRIAFAALILAAVGELVYLRPVLLNPSIILKAIVGGEFAAASYAINAEQVTGLTSLVNLYLVPTAIYSMLGFNIRVPRRTRRQFVIRLSLLGSFVVIHALLFSGRMFIVYFIAIAGASYLLGKPHRAIKLRYLLLAAMFPAAIIWLGATIRDGGRYAYRTGLGYFHPETQQYVRDVLMQGYFGADFNNALIYLGCVPNRELIGSTMFANVARKFGYVFTDVTRCYPEYQSDYGTVNTLALWWMDLGWGAIAVALAVGGAVGYTHRVALTQKIGFWTILYLLAFPGIFSTIRINYFFLTIFVLPASFVILTAAALYLFSRRPRRSRRAQAAPAAPVNV